MAVDTLQGKEQPLGINALISLAFRTNIAEKLSAPQMPAVQTSLEYLQKLPLYQEEKPYWCFLTPREGFDPDKQRVDNLEFEAHENITIQDIRESSTKMSLEECGFQVIPHKTENLSFESAEAVTTYKSETEGLLQETFGAVYVVCYDTQLRKNVPFKRSQLDLNDPLTAEGPARGAHNGMPRSYTLS